MGGNSTREEFLSRINFSRSDWEKLILQSRKFILADEGKARVSGGIKFAFIWQSVAASQVPVRIYFGKYLWLRNVKKKRIS